MNRNFETDVFYTKSHKKITITFIQHASLMFDIDGYIVHIDPVSEYADYSLLPKADLVLITHDHYDHFDKKAIDTIWQKDKSRLICSPTVANVMSEGEMIKPNDKIIVNDFITLYATEAYNITAEHLRFHPKDLRNVGFILEIDSMRFYISGDTEDVPEMKYVKDIDVAFISTNQPFTMTPKQCINAIEMIKPKIVYPYHLTDTNISSIVEKYKKYHTIEVRIRRMQ